MGHSCAHGANKNAKKDEREIRIQQALGRVKHKLLVMSGKGGVGKSTVAVNLAVALAKSGKAVGLMDVDLHGPSIPGLTGLVNARAQKEGDLLMPIPFMANLNVVSMGNFLPNIDDAVIWRGPLKITAIRQFLGDVNWGDLDYLIIDAPPGTGDEPLTVAQDVTGVQAIVVTTPQEVSLADVRKSLNFCRNVSMPVAGVIENMSGYLCSNCGHTVDLFGRGGGEKTAGQMNVPFLGAIPFEPLVVASGDSGKPFLLDEGDTVLAKAYADIIDRLEQGLANAAPPVTKVKPAAGIPKDGCFKIAIPTAQGILCPHFGHCEKFAVVTVKNNQIIDKTLLDPPPHEPGVIPPWLAQQGANLIIAGGMGEHAQTIFREHGVEVVVGAPSLAVESLVTQYLAGELEAGKNVCDH